MTANMNTDLSVLTERLESLAAEPTWQRDWKMHLMSLNLVGWIQPTSCVQTRLFLAMVVSAIAHPEECTKPWAVVAAELFAKEVEMHIERLDIPEFEAADATLQHWNKHLNEMLSQAPTFNQLHDRHHPEG